MGECRQLRDQALQFNLVPGILQLIWRNYIHNQNCDWFTLPSVHYGLANGKFMLEMTCNSAKPTLWEYDWRTLRAAAPGELHRFRSLAAGKEECLVASGTEAPHFGPCATEDSLWEVARGKSRAVRAPLLTGPARITRPTLAGFGGKSRALSGTLWRLKRIRRIRSTNGCRRRCRLSSYGTRSTQTHY